MDTPLLDVTPSGLYCAAGDFYIDPWRPVGRAVVTHAHADHARPGSAHYLVARPGLPLFARRLGADAAIDTLGYGERRRIGDVDVSLHPAGHVLGSAQVRIAHRGEAVVVSGDYKLAPDPTCAPFEPVRADLFVTESTFGLPIYRWESPAATTDALSGWWAANAADGHASVLFVYALGKAQRVLAELARADAFHGPIGTHGAVEALNDAYRAAGIALPATLPVGTAPAGTDWSRALILAPPSAQGSPWLRRFGAVRTAFASGWMAIRGARRRRNVDRGFVLSDHADWPGLNAAIAASGAPRVAVTHGYRDELVRWLAAQGRDAYVLETAFEGEHGAAADDAPPAAAPPASEDAG
ncbi:MAG: ligase-associated DNA damage response exonuclease [Proteobacteria bacterium]|nr:ligase-associated DNA damage response exonuclease [Pseudomonadota bacterium]